MNLKQLQAFREVMLTGSVSEAGRNLSRTQPAITTMIAGLEKSIGYELFSRRGGRLHPVPEAHYLLDEANIILDRLASVQRTMKSIRNLERGSIRMASMPGPAAFLLPELISRFISDRQGIKVTLLSRSSPQVRQLVSVQQYDVGLADLGLDGEIESPLVSHKVIKFECVCAMRCDDSLARKTVVTPQDLDGLPMATLYEAHPTTVQTRVAFESAGARLNACFETQYFLPALTFVERGLAYSIVDPLSAESYKIYKADNPQLVFRSFHPAVYLVTAVMRPIHRPISKVAQAFTTYLEEEIEYFSKLYKPGSDAVQ